jgi:TnpA family transposase
LAAVLVDGTNLGLTRMADASHGISYHHLVNVAQWHISDDNYVAARAAIVNAHHKHPMAAIWDDGTTASSDGQYFRAGGRAGAGGAINAKYGIEPGFVFYTQVSGRYSLFYTQVIAAMVSEAPYVLDGLMHHVHQTDLRIREHRRVNRGPGRPAGRQAHSRRSAALAPWRRVSMGARPRHSQSR